VLDCTPKYTIILVTVHENNGNVLLECIAGMYCWNVFLECIAGMYSWNVLLECIPGMYCWNVKRGKKGVHLRFEF
jgi:hypothetical protein